MSDESPAPSPSADDLDFSLDESVRRLLNNDDPRCGHCATVLATIGLSTGDMIAAENRRELSGCTTEQSEALFSTARKLAKLMTAPTDGATCELCLGPGASSTAEDADTGDRYDVHDRCAAKIAPADATEVDS